MAFDVSRTPTSATLAHCGVLVSYEMRCGIVDDWIQKPRRVLVFSFLAPACSYPPFDTVYPPLSLSLSTKPPLKKQNRAYDVSRTPTSAILTHSGAMRCDV